MQAARWVWVGWILARSVMALLLGLVGSGRFGHEACESLDHDPLLFVVELLPQARLGNGKVVEEFQMQLWHGSPGLRRMGPTRQFGRGEHRRWNEGEASLPQSPQESDRPREARRNQSRSRPQESGIYSRPVRSERNTNVLVGASAGEQTKTGLQTEDGVGGSSPSREGSEGG